MVAEDFCDTECEVCGGDSVVECTVEVDADDFWDEDGDWLAEHGGFCFDATDAPAYDSEAVDHGGV